MEKRMWEVSQVSPAAAYFIGFLLPATKPARVSSIRTNDGCCLECSGSEQWPTGYVKPFSAELAIG